VTEHNRVVTELGSVWWGWWAKAGEKPPEEEFQALRAVAVSDGLPLFLYDSGRNTVFRATCTAIEFAPGTSVIPSPASDYTPEYYRKTHHPAWFKLGAIRQATPDDINEFVYVRVDQFFTEGISRFGRFYGTRIRLEDLNGQQRSIWFASPAKVNSRKTPRDKDVTAFPVEFTTTRSARLLWISDLHFSRNAREHGFALERETVRQPLAEAILRVLHEATRDNDVGGLIVSGDLTFRASEDEFDLAAECLNELLSRSGLDPSQLIVVPGNHDLEFTHTPWKKGAKVALASSTARRQYEKFYAEVRHHSASPHLSMGARLLLGGAVPVEVVGLNSSALQQKAGHFQGHGFVGQDQLDEAARQMRWIRPAPAVRAYRIAVLHHHVVPMTPRHDPKADERYSVVLDAGALLTWLADHRVDLVLHGHEHQPGVSTVTTLDRDSHPHTLTIVASGSTGAAPGLIGEIRYNLFALADFSGGAPGPTIQHLVVNENADGRLLAPAIRVPTLEQVQL
jgi:3',5'-cyclic AMP phosphodiesterase CpdA